MEGKDLSSFVIGHYLIDHELAQSTWGQSYVAIRMSTGEVVNLRVLPESYLNSERSLRAAAGRVSSINCGGLQKTQQVTRSENNLLLASDLINGEALPSLVQRNGPLSPLYAIDCVLKASRVLAVPAESGIFHPEIRPSKILMAKDGTCSIRDIVVTQAVKSRKKNVEKISSLFSAIPVDHLRFMAPEYLFQPDRVDVRTDLYSLSCILFFLLTGKPVFQIEDPIKLALAHREKSLPDLTAPEYQLHPAWNAFFKTALSKSVEDRFPSHLHFQSALTTVRDKISGSKPQPPLDWKFVYESRDLLDTSKIKPLSRYRWKKLVAFTISLCGVLASLTYVYVNYQGNQQIVVPGKVGESDLDDPSSETRRIRGGDSRDATIEVKADEVINF